MNTGSWHPAFALRPASSSQPNKNTPANFVSFSVPAAPPMMVYNVPVQAQISMPQVVHTQPPTIAAPPHHGPPSCYGYNNYYPSPWPWGVPFQTQPHAYHYASSEVANQGFPINNQAMAPIPSLPFNNQVVMVPIPAPIIHPNQAKSGIVPLGIQRGLPVGSNSMWGQRYAELLEFKRVNGHCNVPQRYGASSLGVWVKDQRTMKRRGRMSRQRTELLEKIGFSWSIKSGIKYWDTKVKELIVYKELHGHCNVPLNYDRNDYVLLARWVDRVRRNKKKGKISKERIKQLDGIGFDWSPPKYLKV
jgi:hypothetical protein